MFNENGGLELSRMLNFDCLVLTLLQLYHYCQQDPIIISMSQFQAKQVVWAKINGYPWWPALITRAPKSMNEDYRINFFGEKHYAYVTVENLANYKEMYDHYAHLRGKNHAPESSIREADNYLKQQRGLRTAESVSQVQSMKRVRSRRHLTVEVPEDVPLKKREAEMTPISPFPMECEVLEVDFKKLNQVESQWKGFLQVFVEGNPESKKEAFLAIKTFDFTALNNEQLSRTKITNILKYLQGLSRDTGQKDFEKYFFQLFQTLKTKILNYLSSTDYYQQFLMAHVEEENQEEEEESVESSTNFEDKVFDLLKRNYHFKKDNARVLSERIGRRLEDLVTQKKCQIIKDLKSKTKELKPGRKEHISEEEVQKYLQKIMGSD